MKPPVLLSLFIMALITFTLTHNSSCSHNLNVLLITGGHSFDSTEFFQLFESFEGISVDTVSQPNANALLEEINSFKYDVIVFYDMWQDITESQKEAYMRLMETGTGMIFLHHSLVSYQHWDEFEKMVGGRYWLEENAKDLMDISGYEHDLKLHVTVLNQEHPVTKDIRDFQILDEGYSNIEVLPSVIPLLETNHPSCAKYIAWANEYKQSRIVYMMLGHDKNAYKNEAFRMLIRNAIQWTSRKT
jgi:type 1 glutamine amidotransferase